VRLGDRLCDLSYANPYEGAQRLARDAIRRALDDERVLDLQYTPFGGQTIARRLVADALRKDHGLPWAFRHVVLTPGAMAALHLALQTAGESGDEVVVPIPCWLDYPLYVRARDRVPILVRCTDDAGELDVDALRAALSPATCAVLLSHPSNPGGRAYSVGTISRLAEALAAAEDDFGREITLISDETHRDFTSAGTHWSAARSYHRTVIVYSYGKYHFLQGQRLGYAACSPAHPRGVEVADEMVRWTRISGIATPTALMQRALPFLQDLRYDLSWLARWRDLYAAELAGAGYDVVRPNATLFMYVATPGGMDDFHFASALAEGGVLVMPAPVFHDRGHFRIAFTGSQAMLERALPVLREAVA
jgi:aspartate aminotransferase